MLDTQESRGRRHIVLDNVTRMFIYNLARYRKAKGFTMKRVAALLGISYDSYRSYEHFFDLNKGKRGLPTIKMLLKLAEFYEYDLSGSLNWKYYREGIDRDEIYTLYKHSGLTYAYIAVRLRISHANVYNAICRNHSSQFYIQYRVRDFLRNYVNGAYQAEIESVHDIQENQDSQEERIIFRRSKWNIIKSFTYDLLRRAFRLNHGKEADLQ